MSAQAASTNFHFVQLTDLHWGTEEHLARTRWAVDSIRRLPPELKPDFVVVTGDMMADNILDEPAAVEGLRLLRSLNVPVHYLPGNHDILRHDLLRTRAAYTNLFGPRYHRAEHAGVTLLFVDAEPPRKNDGGGGTEAIEWLSNTLTQAQSQSVIVFQHAPAVLDFYDGRLRKHWSPKTIAAWTNLLQRPNVQAVITGHFHRDELHWLGRVPLYVSGPLAGYWGRQGSYRIYEYRDGRLSYRTVYLE